MVTTPDRNPSNMSIVSYALNFEDVMLWRALGDLPQGFYIDIGAQDPVVDSVSKAFHDRGWRGVHVEPATGYAERLRQERPGDEVRQVAIGRRRGELTLYEVENSGLSTGDPDIASAYRNEGKEVHETVVDMSPSTICSKVWMTRPCTGSKSMLRVWKRTLSLAGKQPGAALACCR